MDSKTSKKRRWLSFGIRLAMTAGILAIILKWLQPDELFAAMAETGLALWLFAVVSQILLHVAIAFKWRILLEAAGARPGMLDTLRAHGSGIFAGLYLPSLIGGDFLRASLIAPGGKNLGAAITGGLADRLVDLAALITLAAAGLAFVPRSESGMEVRILTYTSIPLLAVVVGGILGIRFLSPERLPASIGRIVAKLRGPLDLMLARKSATLIAFLASVVIQGLFVLQNVFIGKAMGIDVPMGAWFVAWPLAKLASFTPLSIGGLGVREGVLAALLSPFSVFPKLAVAQSLVWQTVMYGTGLFAGLASLWIGRFRSNHKENEIVAEATKIPAQ